MLRGSCLCQGVAFEIDGAVIDLLYCHCAMCRKAHGSAFRARGKVKASQFHWTRGEDLVRYFESSPGTHRGFCSTCGSNLLSRFDQSPGVLGLALGVLDDDPGNRPICHVFVGSKAPWHEITDSLPQFEELPSGPVGLAHGTDATQARASTPPAQFISPTPVLASLDIERSVEFFVSKLGFEKVRVSQGKYGIVSIGSVQIHFWACTDRRIAEATSCRVRVQGIQRLHGKCASHAIVHPNAPLASKPWGTMEFAILDPDGNLITFHEDADA